MGTQFHGLVSLLLISAAVCTAVAVLLRINPALGLGYVAGSCLAGLVVMAFFCAKCPCRENCGHVIPGKVLRRLGISRGGAYTPFDLAATGTALMIMLVLPQIWLWRQPAGLFLFWALLTPALVQIRLRVCRTCDNAHCPGNPKFGHP